MADENGDESPDEGYVFVFDRRNVDGKSVKIPLGGLFDYSLFKTRVLEEFEIGEDEDFVVVSTSRIPILDDLSYEEMIESGDTLYLLNDAKQELLAPVQEHIEYLPHYDTLVKSGMYEYYASAGQSPLPFAIAELIDNALAATVSNDGPREIKVFLCFENTPGDNLICVSDNGRGMTPKDLNNWAIYRLSKFNRQMQAGKTSPMKKKIRDEPRSLNSDISYFGVGGKQAIFFIGNATRVITKTKGSNDVHELSLSKADFERKAKLKEPIYAGFINNRRIGDCSHIPQNCKTEREFVESEKNKNSFTNIIIDGIEMETVKFLRQNFKCLCKQLSHIYHYYLHGPMGKVPKRNAGVRIESPFKNIDIKVILREKGSTSHQVSLSDIEDDLESLIVDSAASHFEFNAHVQEVGKVEGVLRYHPFLYDKETFPHSPNVQFTGDQTGGDVEEELRIDSRSPRGDKPIFECFWNGRLIPYTTIDYLDWCAPLKKRSLVPTECYYRVSGALFTNDSFQVSTNKLTFMDLEVKLRDRSTVFSKVVMGQEQRVNIGRAFNEWVKNCHEVCDKQIKFFGLDGNIKRTNPGQKRSQGIWSVYRGVEWDGKVFKVGQLVRTTRTVPIVVGKLKRFLLAGIYDEDEVFATGGQMEITQEPESIFGELKVFPLAKLDRAPSISSLKEFVQAEELRLPASLSVEWPEGNKVSEDDKVSAGSTIGPLRVDILNGRGESVSSMPGDRLRKLLVELKIVQLSETKGEKTLVQHTCSHGGKSWPYWFHKMENLKDVGYHVIQLRTQLSDNTSTQIKSLPSLDIKFSIIEAQPDKFTVGLLETPLRIGLPFQIPLQLQDKFGNVVKPSQNFGEPILTSSGMNFTSSGTCSRGTSLVIRDVVAMGAIPSTGGKDFNLMIRFSGLKGKSQSIRIRLLPGLPSLIEVTEGQIVVENGEKFQLDVAVKDIAGNLTSQPRMNVCCKLYGIPNLPVIICDCSSTGKGTLTSPQLKVKQTDSQQKIIARIDMQHYRNVSMTSREIVVKPSTKASRFDVFYTPPGSEKQVKIENNQEIQCCAGDVVQGLSFILFDEGNRQLSIDSNVTSKLKVNWVGRLNKEEVKRGRLPNIKAPTAVDDIKYCQVSFSVGDNTVEHVFHLKSTHAAPSTLKSSCANVKFKMYEKLSADIVVSLYDVYGNMIKLDPKDFTDFSVSGEGLMHSFVSFISQGFFNIRNVSFEAGMPGPREVTIKMKEIVCYQRLEMLPGAASNLVLVDLDNEEPVEILNGSEFPKPLTIQLIDSAGNLAKEKNVKCLLARDSGIKLTPPPPQQRTDANGQATFNQFSISAERGLYQLVPKAMLPSGTKEGPVVLVSVAPDRNKPVHVVAKFDETAAFIAGEKFPVVEAYVIAEDQNPLTTIKKKDLVLKIFSSKSGKSSDSMSNAPVFTCTSGSLNSPKNHFFFREIVCPEKAGQYNLVVQYIVDNTVILASRKFTITVNPNEAVKLVPVSVPATPTVTNNSKSASRQLVRKLKFQLKDKFGNTAGTEIKGHLKVNVEAGDKEQVPMLQNGETSASFQLEKGSSSIESLLLQSGSKGVDGKEYVLSFEAVLGDSEITKIEPFKLSFLFYDDVAKQAEMAEITKDRDRLTESIDAYRFLFDALSQLYKEIQAALREATAEERNLKNELRVKNFNNVNSLKTKEEVSNALALTRQKKVDLEAMPRRQCRLPRGPSDKDVIGKVAHLAELRDDDVARVLSWHLASDMDCVITVTLEQAKRIHKDSRGRQQVLPLESIYKKGLSDWKKPLPHIRYPGIKSSGSVVYARDLLNFPEHQEHCKTVFIMLLGDTIIADNLDAANKYRQEVVKYTYCPTILTRTGDRIRSNGKFGGLQNRAPPLERLSGVVFASPLPSDYHDVCAQLDLLSSLEAAAGKVEGKKMELQAHIEHCNSEKVQKDYQECLEAENQLQSIEKRLGLTPRVGRLPPSLSEFLRRNGANCDDYRSANKRASVADVINEGPSPSKRGRTTPGPQHNAKKSFGQKRR
ncbi:structural maintenance of chromosomes flexible hinge domain-containing protein 1-like isoform X2 [Rhopilema esculentum]|uniref:structural maintenance of chromosomes flexible hinge domain-containing protein 1-like isoform X2 n=1 Tax=Rhopilema esculentum TaxID=499914 RepID=UPI0031DFA1F6